MADFLTISGLATGEYKEKGSKFLSFAKPIAHPDEAKQMIAELREAHPQAVHVVSAYRLGPAGEPFRASDDGEPAGSSGIPVLNALRSAELTNTIICVVRYFGGTKLGVPGLIRAYRATAEEALQRAEVVKDTERTKAVVTAPLNKTGILQNYLKRIDARISSQVYDSMYRATAEVPIAEMENLKAWCASQLLHCV